MSVEVFRRLSVFVLLGMMQVLVMSHIHLFGIATPLLYVYFAITFRRNFPRWAILVSCFALGLWVDVFSNTPGLAAGTMTLLGFLRPFLLEWFVPRDSVEDLGISMNSLGVGRFVMLSIIMVVLYCLIFFALEAFTFFNWQFWLECAGSSAALTLLLIFSIEFVRIK